MDNYLVIRGGSILEFSEHRARPLDVVVRDGRIADLAAPGAVTDVNAAVVDAHNRLLVPGLVNAHTHGHAALAKGRGDRWLLELLLNAGPWTSGYRGVEEKYLSAKLNAAEMVMKGCTAAYDMHLEIPAPSVAGVQAVAQAYADVGMRAVVAPMMSDRSLYTAIPGLLESLPNELQEAVRAFRYETPEATGSVCRELLAGWKHDRHSVYPGLAPTIPIFCSDELLRVCGSLADEFGAPLQMHLLESRPQAVSGVKWFGKTIAAHLDDLGLLNERFTGAHGVWLDADDMKRLGERGCSISHNPGSNLLLGSGIAPIRRLLDHGVNVGIGTDGANSSDQQNMFEAMRLASMVSRIATPDCSRWLATAEVMELATAGSARAMGMDKRIGKLTPGYEADVVFLDLDSINYVPLNDPTNQVVNCEDSRSVDKVMIAGRLVYDGGRFLTFDYDALKRQVRQAMHALDDRAAPSRRLADRLSPLVSRFCIGLAGEPYHVDRTCWHHQGDRAPAADAAGR